MMVVTLTPSVTFADEIADSQPQVAVEETQTQEKAEIKTQSQEKVQAEQEENTQDAAKAAEDSNPTDSYGLITKSLKSDGNADFETSIAVKDSIDASSISVNSVYEGVDASAPKSPYDVVLGEDFEGNYANGDGTNNVWNSKVDGKQVNTSKPEVAENGQQYASITTEDDSWFDDAFKRAADLIAYVEENGTEVDGKYVVDGHTYVFIKEDVVNKESAADGKLVDGSTGLSDAEGRSLDNAITYLCKLLKLNITGSELYGNFYAPDTEITISGSNICGQVICDTWDAKSGAEVHMPNKGVKPTPDYPVTPNGEPEDPSDDETPDDETPNDETPEDETPNDETPDDETPNDETPEDETPNDETPEDETKDPSDDPQNPNGNPEDPAEEETPDDETPDDETPDDEPSDDEPKTPSDDSNGADGDRDAEESDESETPETPTDDESADTDESDNSPSTGDDTPVGAAAAMMLFAAAIGTIARRKHEN